MISIYMTNFIESIKIKIWAVFILSNAIHNTILTWGKDMRIWHCRMTHFHKILLDINIC